MAHTDSPQSQAGRMWATVALAGGISAVGRGTKII